MWESIHLDGDHGHLNAPQSLSLWGYMSQWERELSSSGPHLTGCSLWKIQQRSFIELLLSPGIVARCGFEHLTWEIIPWDSLWPMRIFLRILLSSLINALRIFLQPPLISLLLSCSLYKLEPVHQLIITRCNSLLQFCLHCSLSAVWL